MVATPNVWRFGECEFDEAEGRLTIAGRVVELDRSCRALLALLLRHAGEEVGKERLLEAGWPGRIVHENSLAKAIGRLRQVLGADGASLETVYGHGYRLNVALRPGGAEAGHTPAAEATQRRAQGSHRLPARWIAGAVVLALVGGAGATMLVLPGDGAEVPYRATPPLIGDAPDAVGRVLWVDDHPQNNIYEKRYFENHRIAVHNVTGSADALRLLAMYDYTVVISDMGRGEDRLAGLRLAGKMRASGDTTPLIIYTLRPDGAAAQQAQRELVAEAGAQGVVVTPQEVRAVILKVFGNPAARPAG